MSQSARPNLRLALPARLSAAVSAAVGAGDLCVQTEGSKMLARRRLLSLLVVILLGTPLVAPPAHAQGSQIGLSDHPSIRRSPQDETFVPGQVIVGLRPSADFSLRATNPLQSLQARFAGLGISAATAVLP